MTDVITKQATDEEIIAELRVWLEENWDPEITVGEWWERLGLAGWAAPSLPTTAFGRGVARSVSVKIAQEIAQFGALSAPNGLGLLLAAPTIADHGTTEQIDTMVRAIVTGQRSWCQLFSEPGAGSDLAGLTTRAELDGDEWVINGQKVWTSLGQSADVGMLIARTDPDAPKHKGISYFAIDMHQDGVEVRPLTEMTGHAMFNETFLTEARVPAAAMIGDKGNGWAVANSTLAHERSGLGSGGGSAGSPTAIPGTVAGNLSKRVGDFVEAVDRTASPSAPAAGEPAPRKRRDRIFEILLGLAQGNGKATNGVVRQDLVRLFILGELGRFNAERSKAVRASGGDIAGMANISKLSQSNIVRLQRDLGLGIVGPAGMLHAYEASDNAAIVKAAANPFLPAVTMTALYAQAPPIYGGTDQIQRNIISERALGLPKEPGSNNAVPFSQLPKNG
jgi:alkylation response protein AidB-like acyl-CoA dehydrogenase